MELILKENVAHLGFKDEIVDVKDGYGRNYLIPKGKAILATSSAKKVLAENLKQKAFKEKAIIDEANKLAKKIEKLEIKVKTKVGPDGKLFGSISNIDISNSLAENKIELEKIIPTDLKKIKLNQSKYSFLTNEKGGIYDDLIITKVDNGFSIILNAACKDNDFKIIKNSIGNKFKLTLFKSQESPISGAVEVPAISLAASQLELNNAETVVTGSFNSLNVTAITESPFPYQSHQQPLPLSCLGPTFCCLLISSLPCLQTSVTW